MAHSSGGGSHGGGFHGGSHGGSFGGFGARGMGAPRSRLSGRAYSSRGIRSAAYPGAERYVYYSGLRPHYVYSDADPSAVRRWRITARVIVLTACTLLLAGAVWMFFSAFAAGKKLNAPETYEVYVEDTVGVLGNTDDLYAALEELYAKTGVCPWIVTVYNEDWKPDGFLEDYALGLYYEHFSDEDHWLFVYSVPRDPSGEFVDWYWEGIQGDHTDRALPDTVGFNERLTALLCDEEKYTVTSAFTETIRAYAEGYDKPIFRPQFLLFGLLMIAVAFFIARYRLPVGTVKKEDRVKYRAVPCPPEGKHTECKCEFCGGVYLSGTCRKCPYCSVVLPSED